MIETQIISEIVYIFANFKKSAAVAKLVDAQR